MTSPITPAPFPSVEEEWTHRPDADEVRLTAAGIVGAVTPPDGLTEVQRAVLNAHVVSMTEHPVDVDDRARRSGPKSSPRRCATATRRSASAWCRSCCSAEMLLVPIPHEVSERVETYAGVARAWATT